MIEHIIYCNPSEVPDPAWWNLMEKELNISEFNHDAGDTDRLREWLEQYGGIVEELQNIDVEKHKTGKQAYYYPTDDTYDYERFVKVTFTDRKKYLVLALKS